MAIPIQEYHNILLTCPPIFSLDLPLLETASKVFFGNHPFPFLRPCGSGGIDCASWIQKRACHLDLTLGVTSSLAIMAVIKLFLK